MKSVKIISLLIIFNSASLFGQEITQTKWVSSEYGPHYGLTVTITGDLNKFVSKLKRELGKPSKESKSGITTDIDFLKLEKLVWSNEKINLQFMIMSNNDTHIITVGCLTEIGGDLLEPKTKTQLLISEFLVSCLR